MQFGTEFVIFVAVVQMAVVFAQKIHRGQRGHAHPGHAAARIEGRCHIHTGFGRGIDIEPVGPGHRRTVQQGMDRDHIGFGVGPFDPEFLEKRKFLAIVEIACADRQTARRQAVLLVAAQKTEIGRTQKRDQLVRGGRSTQRVMDTETGIAQIRRQRFLETGFAIIEGTRRIGIGFGIAVTHQIQLHGTLEQMPGMERLQMEPLAWIAQRILVATEPDFAPGVKIQRRQLGRQGWHGGIIFGLGQFACPPHHVIMGKHSPRNRRFAARRVLRLALRLGLG